MRDFFITAGEGVHANEAVLGCAAVITSAALLLLCAKKKDKRQQKDIPTENTQAVNKTAAGRQESVYNENVTYDDALTPAQAKKVSSSNLTATPNGGAIPSEQRTPLEKGNSSQQQVSSQSHKSDEKKEQIVRKESSSSEIYAGFKPEEETGDFADFDDDVPENSPPNNGEENHYGFEEAETTDSSTAAIPAWYAGKLSRDLCEEVVLAASKGDFLVRESTRGDRCVICINIGDTVMNLMVVSKDGKYRFAGKDRDGLAEVIFFLRLKPLRLKSGPCKVAKAAPGLAEAQKKDKERHDALENAPDPDGIAGFAEIDEDARRRAEQGRKLEFRQSHAPQGRPLSESGTDGQEITADDLYDDAAAFLLAGDEGDEEPLYVDMFDANIPSSEWIAREEERHRLQTAGLQRLSNEEFGNLRIEARKRAEDAAKQNRKLVEQARKKSVIRRAWKKSESGQIEEAPASLPQEKDKENFFDYQNASMREFGGFDEDDIYDSVPAWFAGKLSREACDRAVLEGGAGTYILRESSTGDRYIICINWSGEAKNFQIYITKDGGYRFSGHTYPDLQRLVSTLQKQGITKHGKTCSLDKIAQW